MWGIICPHPSGRDRVNCRSARIWSPLSLGPTTPGFILLRFIFTYLMIQISFFRFKLGFFLPRLKWSTHTFMVSFRESISSSHLSTAVAWREKKCKHFVFNKYFSLVLGVLKSKISKKSLLPLLRTLNFKLFYYKARVQLVRKITTIATRNRG